jgi:Chaperone of endosialidase
MTAYIPRSVQSIFPSAEFGSNAAAWSSNALSNCQLQGGTVQAVSLGTAAAPAYSWTTSTNTGVYVSNTGNLTLACSSSNYLSVGPNGVGIGMGVQPGKPLDVNGAARLLGRIEVNDGTDGGTSRGISFWNATTPYAMYASSATSYNGGLSCRGYDFTGTALRLRVPDDQTAGVIFENASEARLFSVNGRTGEAWFLGDVSVLSDARCKRDLCRIDNALDKVRRLNGYTFHMLEDTRGGDPEDRGQDEKRRRKTGLLAQEVAACMPEAVVSSDETAQDGLLSVSYGSLMGLVVEAIKALDANQRALRRKLVTDDSLGHHLDVV